MKVEEKQGEEPAEPAEPEPTEAWNKHWRKHSEGNVSWNPRKKSGRKLTFWHLAVQCKVEPRAPLLPARSNDGFGGTTRLVQVQTGSPAKEQKAPRARSPQEEPAVPLWVKREIRFSSPRPSQQPGRSWLASTGAGVEAPGTHLQRLPGQAGRPARTPRSS